MEAIFWISTLSLVFIYVLYAPILMALSALGLNYRSRKKKITSNFFPEVSIVVAAYNEELVIEEKIQNTFDLVYPKSKLKIYIVSDGSTDKTNDIIKKYTEVNLLYKPERKGKIHAMNRAMTFVNSELTIFTDANCFLNKEAVEEIVKKFCDPEVGAVSGAKHIWVSTDSKSNAQGEGLYWKLESYLKTLDSKFYSVIGAPGELFSIRTKLFEPVKENTILDDFAITLNINTKGYRTAFAPMSKAYETASQNLSEEFTRKVRIATGGFQIIFDFFTKVSPLKNFRLFFQYYFRRVSRWTIAPIALILALITNTVLFFSGNVLYQYLFVSQVLFYAFALYGFIVREKNITYKILLIPYYFTFMHLAVIKGFYNFLLKNQNVAWKKVKRLDLKKSPKEDLSY